MRCLTHLLLLCNTATAIKNTQAFIRGRGEISAEETFLAEKSAAEKKHAGLKAASLLQNAKDHFSNSLVTTSAPTEAPVTNDIIGGINLTAVHALLDTAKQGNTVDGSRTVKTHGIENINSTTVTTLLDDANAKSDSVPLFDSSTFSKTDPMVSAAPASAPPTKGGINRKWKNSVGADVAPKAPKGSVRAGKTGAASPSNASVAPSTSPSLPEISVKPTTFPVTTKKGAKKAKQSSPPEIAIPTISPSSTYAPSSKALPKSEGREASPKSLPLAVAISTVSPLTVIPTNEAPLTVIPTPLTRKTPIPVGFARSSVAPGTFNRPTLGPASSTPRLHVVQEPRANVTEFHSGEIRSVHSMGVLLKMTGDFDINVDGNAIFKAIEMKLTDYLALTVPYLDTFELFLKFQSKAAKSNETSISGSDTSNVAVASVSMLMHLSSEQKGVLEDFTPQLTTDLLRSAFSAKGVHDLLSAIVDYGVDMSSLELIHDSPSTVESPIEKYVTSIPATDPHVKEGISSNSGLLSAMLGGSFIFAIGAAAFTKTRRTSHDVDDSEGSDESEDLEAGDSQKNFSTSFPNLLPIEYDNGYVDSPRRLFQDGDKDSIDISLMDGPDLIASSSMDQSLQTKMTNLKDSLREKLKWVSQHGDASSEHGIGCTTGGEMMYAVDLL